MLSRERIRKIMIGGNNMINSKSGKRNLSEKKLELKRNIEIAFKKLKASVYYDKTLLALRDSIVLYETDTKNPIEMKLENLADSLLSSKPPKDGDAKKKELESLSEETNSWNAKKKKILSSISVISLPKKIATNQHIEKSVILNSHSKAIKVTHEECYLDMDVEGHILSILWIMEVGIKIDSAMYKHSYGNRLRKDSIEKNYSPNLFQPYFSQYESWRDKGLKQAKECLDSGSDALILMLDFKRFFYSIEIDENDFVSILEDEQYFDVSSSLEEWVPELHAFMYEIIKCYSVFFSKKALLPIHFFPSNILSNWVLDSFDKQIITRWNPVYYGRYVDDIIIIDKVEKNSEIRKWVEEDTLKIDKIMEYYLCNCNAEKNKEPICEAKNNRALFTKKGKVYKVNPNMLSKNKKSNLVIQEDKVKCFYFREEESSALITCFQKEIAKNASGFKFLPDDSSVIDFDDYEKIFKINFSDTVNKLRGIKEFAIDKYELSKFLGQYLRIGELVNNNKESKFTENILKIFESKALIENYLVWEKIIQILIENDKIDELKKFVEKIFQAIKRIELEEKLERKEEKLEDRFPSLRESKPKVQEGLLRILHSSLCRALSLSWGKNIVELINNINDFFGSFEASQGCDLNFFCYKEILRYRRAYCLTRMTDKYALPLMIDFLINEKLSDSKNKKLFSPHYLNNFSNADTALEKNYKFYPYMITPQELSFSLMISSLNYSKAIDTSSKMLSKIEEYYYKLNYNSSVSRKNTNKSCFGNIEITELVKSHPQSPKQSALKIGDKKNQSLKIGVANAELHKDNFEAALNAEPNHSYARYRDLVKIVDDAIKENVQLLVLPESYLPLSWLPLLSRLCAKNQMTIITGIEHVRLNKDIYNLTAIILPYQEEEYRYAYIDFHQKIYFSPNEKDQIINRRLEPREGNNYRLYNWNDIWFSTYCCFELASIEDRALFQSYVDLVIAIEWNSDTNYYSSIIDSLARDMHCYCLQVNSSNYGDSRITQPSRTEIKDIIKTKGGKNRTILSDTINIAKLRDFQFGEYGLQKADNAFKPTPPNFSKDIIEQKIKGTLWDNLPRSKDSKGLKTK